MKQFYIAWGVLVCFMMIAANSSGTSLFKPDLSGGYSSSGSSSGSWGRGWSTGGGGFHK